MTVSSTTTRVSFSGDGSTTVFAYTFKIFDDDDITVILRSSTGTETVQTKTTNYSVSGVGNTNGGNVTMVTAPATGETLVLRRTSAQTQTTDYVANDPFPAATHEDALDKLTFLAQEQQEELDRAIKISRTNTMTSTEFTVGATDRANKILAFDSSGEISVTQEIGTFQGTDATVTTAAYNERDLVKSTTAAQLNNVYIALQDSPSGTALTNTTYWALVVDAVSAATSATNAASSASAASGHATTATTKASEAATSASTAESHKDDAETAKDAAEAAQTAAETAQSAAETALDTFDDRFLGAKSSDPTVDNDGNALVDGALYFDTTNDLMKVYDLTNTQWRQLALTGSNQTNVNTVAGQISPTNNIATVASRDADIGTVAARDTDIGTVASRDTDIGTVASRDADIGTVASRDTDIGTLAARDTDIGTVAGKATEIGRLGTADAVADLALLGTADVVADLNTLATAAIVADMDTLADVASDITTVADNLSSINDFADKYRIGATDPTTDNDEGDLFYNTTTNTLKIYNGSAFEAGVTAGSGFAALSGATFTGNLTMSGANLFLGDSSGTDNNRLRFGANQDFDLFHDGSSSNVRENGPGGLNLRGTAINIRNVGNTEDMAIFTHNGDVKLFYDDSQKFATTSAGIDVTGTAQADSFTLDNGSNDWTLTVSSNNLIFSYAGTAKMKLDSSGNLTVTGDVISEGTI